MHLLTPEGDELKLKHPERHLILVLCHTYPAGGNPTLYISRHWQAQVIRDMITERIPNKKDVSIYTLDTHGSPDIKMNGFSNDFIDKNQSSFDMIFLPDCGGPWAKAANSGDKNTIKELMERLLTTIKPGGYLYVGKLMSVDPEEIKDYFKEKGFTSTIKNVAEAITYVEVQQKTSRGGSYTRKQARRTKNTRRRKQRGKKPRFF